MNFVLIGLRVSSISLSKMTTGTRISSTEKQPLLLEDVCISDFIIVKGKKFLFSDSIDTSVQIGS